MINHDAADAVAAAAAGGGGGAGRVYHHHHHLPAPTAAASGGASGTSSQTPSPGLQVRVSGELGIAKEAETKVKNRTPKTFLPAATQV